MEDWEADSEFLRAVIESAPNGLLVVELEGRIILVNEEIERQFGYARAELLGRSVDDLLPSRSRRSHSEQRRAFFERPERRSMGVGRELFGRRRDGSEFPVEIGLTPFQSRGVVLVIAAVVDISERLTGETARRDLERQLLQAQKLEAVGTLAAGVAHDFNNILAAITGYAELAIPGSNPAAKSDLTELLGAASRGREIVERILTFARSESPTRTSIDLKQAVEDSVHLLRAGHNSTVELRERLSGASLPILANRAAVQQVVLNLARNAVQASRSGGAVEIAVESRYVRDHVARSHPDLREGSYGVVEVRDEGEGIPADVLPRVFDPFFTTKPVGEGTGLGLSTVRGIMRDHAGAVTLESRSGIGTTVRCYFPLVSDPFLHGAGEPSVADPGHGERILYVEDEEGLSRIGVRILETLGYSVVACRTPESALGRFRAAPGGFDLLLTDYLMPGMDGVRLANEVRQIRPDIPVLLLTGFVHELPHAPTGEPFHLLRKPATQVELARALRESLG